jgi:hypothetical protein
MAPVCFSIAPRKEHCWLLSGKKSETNTMSRLALAHLYLGEINLLLQHFICSLAFIDSLDFLSRKSLNKRNGRATER